MLALAAHFLLPLAGVSLLASSAVLITDGVIGVAAFLVWLAFLMVSKCYETSDSDQESHGRWNDPVANLCQRDGFTIDGCIGGGAWGNVYKVKDSKGKEMILKTIGRNPDGDRGYQDYRRHFTLLANERGEAMGLSLPGHKNLARTYGVVTFDGTTYRIRDRMEEPESEETVIGVLQEYVPGKDLLKILGANPRGLPPEKVVCLGWGITQGLVAMHDAGFLHRDLKPENILVSDLGTVKIVDYGLVRKLGRRERAFSQAYTEWYRPAEVDWYQSHFGGYNAKADSWTLGCVLFEMAYGVPIFQKRDPLLEYYHRGSVTLDKLIPPGRQISHSCKFMDLLRGLLHPNPVKRMSTQEALDHPFFKLIRLQRVG